MGKDSGKNIMDTASYPQRVKYVPETTAIGI
jgi:hypothetical protein